jgi:hypothetical protein
MANRTMLDVRYLYMHHAVKSTRDSALGQSLAEHLNISEGLGFQVIR